MLRAPLALAPARTPLLLQAQPAVRPLPPHFMPLYHLVPHRCTHPCHHTYPPALPPCTPPLIAASLRSGFTSMQLRKRTASRAQQGSSCQELAALADRQAGAGGRGCEAAPATVRWQDTGGRTQDRAPKTSGRTVASSVTPGAISERPNVRSNGYLSAQFGPWPKAAVRGAKGCKIAAQFCGGQLWAGFRLARFARSVR